MVKTSFDSIAPPLAPRVPLLGSAPFMIRDSFEFILRCERRLGPVFALTVPGRRITVVTGPEGAALLGGVHTAALSAHGAYGDMYEALDATDFPLALDGETHARMRRLFGRGYARERLAHRLSDLTDLTAQWCLIRADQELDVQQLAREVTATQLGMLCFDMPPDMSVIAALHTVLLDLLRVHVEHRRPRLVLRRTVHRRARHIIQEFCDAAISARRIASDAGGTLFIDELIRAQDGGVLSLAAVHGAITGTFFAGIDNVAATLAFALFHICYEDGLADAIAIEARLACFSDSPNAIMKAAPETVAALREVMRLHPVSPLIPRRTIQDLVVAGRQVARGSNVLLAPATSHLDESLFPSARRFNPKRFIDCSPSSVPGYMPFGAGPHACPATGMAELQLVVTVLAILRAVRVTGAKRYYVLKTQYCPSPAPSGFRVRLSAPETT